MNWRVGFPGWKLAATLGIPIKVNVDVIKDDEANVYIACSDDIGLALEAESLDTLMAEINAALPELLTLAHSPKQPRTDIRFHSNHALA